MLLKLSMRMLRLMHCLFPIPESIFAALLSTKPWSLSFPKATKEGEINKAREGTTWIKQSVKSDMPYNGVNVPTQGTGFRWEWMDFLLRHCLLCPVFVPLFFWKNLMAYSRLASDSSSSPLFRSVGISDAGHYTDSYSSTQPFSWIQDVLQ